MQASYQQSQNVITQDKISHTKGKTFPVLLFARELQALLLPLAGPSENVYKVEKIQICGTWYARGTAVIVGCDQFYYGYVFGEIVNGIIIEGDDYLVQYVG